MNIEKFIKDDLEIKVKVDGNENLELNLEDVSRGLGFINNRDKIIRWDRVENYILDIYFLCSEIEPPLVVELKQNSNRQEMYIQEWVFYMLCMKARNEKAKKFQLWISKEVLPSLRKSNYYIDKENITNEQLNKLKSELLDITQQRDNFKNILINNRRKKQRLKTFLKDMFPECENVYEQFLDSMKKSGALDGNNQPTQIFIDKNKESCMFEHYTKTSDNITHTLVLSNLGIANLCQRLYLDNNTLKIKK